MAQWSRSESFTGGSVVYDIVEFKGDMYITVFLSGVYRSTDHGETWVKTTVPGQPNTTHFVHYNSLLMVVSAGKLFKTSDGITWSEGTGPDAFVADVSTDGTTIYAATSSGLFKSTDAGASWTKNNASETNAYMGSVAVNGNTVWASGWDTNPGKLLRSENGGVSWTSLTVGTKSVKQIAVKGADTYIIVEGEGLYKSSNNGVDWQHIHNAFSQSYLFVDSNDIFLLDNYRISFSTDGGSTWTNRTTMAPAFNIQSMYTTDQYMFIGTWGGGVSRAATSTESSWQLVNDGLHCMTLNYIKSDGNTLLAGTESSYIRTSTDAGISWSQRKDQYGFSGGNARHFASLDSDLFSAGDAYILRSSDQGSTWVFKDANVRNRIIAGLAATKTTLFAGTNDGMYVSADRGETWNKRSNGITADIRTVYSDGKNVYAGTWDGLFVSTNDGVSWNRISTGLPGQSINAITHVGSVIFVATQFNGLYKTTNGGDSWTPLYSDIVNTVSSLRSALFLTTYDQQFLMSLDSGNNWSNLTPGLPGKVWAVGSIGESLFVGIPLQGVWSRKLTELLPPFLSFTSEFPDSTFQVGHPILLSSDQELRTPGGNVIGADQVKDYVHVATVQGTTVEYTAEIDVTNKVVTLTILNAVEGESYVVTADPLNNISGLSSSPVTSYAFKAIVNHAPVLQETIEFTLQANGSIQFGQAAFIGAFADEDENNLRKIMITSLPQHGTLSLNNTPCVVGMEIEIADLSELKYVSHENFSGTDQWRWKGSDGREYSAKDATVALNVVIITASEELANNHIRIYPNPVSGLLFIDHEAPKAPNAFIQLIDLTGREIKREPAENGSQKTTVDFSELPPGIYMLKIMMSGKEVWSRVVKR